MAIKLNQSNRAAIINKALSAAFDSIDASYERQRSAVANLLYEHAFTEATIMQAFAMPQHWIARADQLVITRHGFRNTWDSDDSKPRHNLPFGMSRPWPNYVGETFKIDDEHPLCDKVDGIAVKCREIWAAKRQFKANLTNLLHSVSTVEKLRQVWPEGEPYFPAPAPVVALPVPADLAAKVNAMLPRIS